MIIALWITAILLTLVYLAAGTMKALTPREKLVTNMGWVEDFSAVQVKAIGVLEILGALGVIVPLATGLAPEFTGVAALCLVLVQAVAIGVHIRRGEQSALAINGVLLALAAAVAVLFFLS